MKAATRSSGYRSALAHRDLRLLLTAFTIDQLGSWAYVVGLGVYVYDQTHSAFWLGSVTICRFLPALVGSFYGGVIAERFERVRVMVTVSSVQAVTMGAITVTAALQGSAAAAIALAAVSSLANTAYAPATAALLPQVAGEADLAAANALNSSVQGTAFLIGPAVGAGLLALSDPTVVFAFNTASFVAAVLLVRRTRVRSRPVDVTEGGRVGPFGQILVGVRAIGSSSAAAILVGYSTLASFIAGTETVLFVVVSKQQLGTGATGYGYLLAAVGLGGILAAPLVNLLATRGRLAAVITSGMVVYCLPSAALVVIHTASLAFLVEVVAGAGTVVVDVLAITALQRSLPQTLMARVFGVFYALVLGATVLGAIVTSALLDAFGLHPVLLGYGLGIPGVVLLCYPALARLDRLAAQRTGELRRRVALLDRLDIFASAGAPVLETLAAGATEVAVPAGTVVMLQGDPADALYTVESGRLDVSVRDGLAGDRHVRTLEAGSYFGEIGLLQSVPRTATVTATSDSRLVRVSGPDFLDALTSNPASPGLLETVSSRLARTRTATAS